MDTFAVKDFSNVQRVNVKDILMFLEKSLKERVSSCSMRTKLLFKNMDDYRHFYIKFIIFCKVYINRFKYFCLPFVYNYFSAAGYSVIPALNEAVFCTYVNNKTKIP